MAEKVNGAIVTNFRPRNSDIMLTQLDNGAYFSPLGDPLRDALNS